MQIREIYNIFLQELKPLYGYDEAVAITNMIFEALPKVTRNEIITEPHRILQESETNALKNALEQLKKYLPPQYITLEAWFYNLSFSVSPAVLIPRPETEELVQLAIEYMQVNHKKTFIDIGTGSGCIAIAIKYNMPQANGYAIDTSPQALAVAKENATRHNTNIQFIQSNFLNEEEWFNAPMADIIISNPPYIPASEKKMLQSNVADYEPGLALFVPDDDPLLFYKKIAAFGKINLHKNGAIFMETHMDYANEVAAHFETAGYAASIKKDIFGKERMVIATPIH